MEDQPTDGMRIGVIAQALRRQWAVVAIVTVLVTLGAGVLASQSSHSYQATTTILIQPLPGNPLSAETASSNNSQSTTVAMQTEASLVNSVAVTDKVNAALKTSLDSGSPRVTVKVPTNTELVQVTYTAATPQAAQSFAQAYATAYLGYRSDLASAAQKSSLANLDAQARTTEAQLQQASKVAAQKNPPIDAASKVQIYASRLSSIQDQIGQVQALSNRPGTVVAPARRPQRPSGLGSLLTVAAGLAVGFILGLILGVWRERRDDRIRATDEPFIMDLPVLATVRVDRARSVVPVGTPLGADQDEAFRRVRTGVVSMARATSVIAVAALSPTEPSAEIAVHLARALAAAGYRITLVDTAIGTEHVAPLMGIDDAFGLSDVVLGGDISRLRPVEVDGVGVIPAGSDPAGAREQYAGVALGDLLSKLRENTDYLLLSTGPVTTSDGFAAVLAAERVVLVVTDRMTTHEQITEVSGSIRRLGVETLGLVVLRRAPRNSRVAEPTKPSPPLEHPEWIWPAEPPERLGHESEESSEDRGSDFGGELSIRSSSVAAQPATAATTAHPTADSATVSPATTKRRPRPYTPVRRQPKGPS